MFELILLLALYLMAGYATVRFFISKDGPPCIDPAWLVIVVTALMWPAALVIDGVQELFCA